MSEPPRSQGPGCLSEILLWVIVLVASMIIGSRFRAIEERLDMEPFGCGTWLCDRDNPDG